MSFYDDASLVFLPSGGAGKDGKAYSIKPVPEYGNELVTNGGFDTDSDWTKGGGATISSGKANIVGDGSTYVYIQQNAVFTTGVKYRVSADVTINSGLGLKFQDGATNENIGFATSSGTYVFEFTAGSNTSLVIARRTAGTAFDSSVDNVSVKEITTESGDFTFSRGSNLTATRVDSNGLIEKGRENLLLQSNSFDTTWVTTNASVTSGQSGYDGSSDAWELTKSAAGGRVVQSVSTSGVNTYSVYAKAGTLDWISLWNNLGTSYFDLANGTKGSTSSSTTIGSEIESVGNGWYRCSLIFNTSISDVRIYATDTNGSLTSTLGNIYIQDAQLELGLVATEYIESGASTGKAGLLEDSPRFDYSGGASCPALLLEPQRSNLVEYSEYFDGTGWAKNGGITTTINTSAVQSPEGVYNATILTSANATSEQQILANRLSTISGTSYAFSVFAKKKDYDFIHLRFQATGGAFAAGSVYFNISSGSVGHEDSGKTGYIEDYGNGWYRCTAVATATATYSTAACRIQLASSDNQSNVVGDGLKGTYVYGATFEAGSYPTSYIPNHSGGSVTRNADDCATLDLSSAGVDGEDVTYFLEFKNNQDLVRDSVATSLRFSSNTSNLGSFRIYRASSSVKKLTIVFQDNGSNFVPSGYEMTSDNPKVVIKRIWATGQIKVFVDGTEVIDGTNTDMNAWYKIDMGGEGSILEVKQLIAFPSALSNTDCEILTGTSYESFAAMATALNYTTYE